MQVPRTKTEWARAMVAMVTGMARPAQRNRSGVSRTAKGKDDQQAGGSPLGKGSIGVRRLRAPNTKTAHILLLGT